MLTLFPTQYSLLAASALKDQVEERYGFDNLTGRLLLHGVSDTYLLAGSTDSYIFKVYRHSHRSLEELKAEVELLTHLKSGGARVSWPLIDRSGKYIQSFNAAEGTRYGVLFTYAPGKSVYDLSDEQISTVGREMARIHQLTSTINLQHKRQEYDIDTTIVAPLKTLKPAFTDDPESYQYLLDTADKVIDKLNSFNTESFSYGYCQYDFLPKNFHFDQNDIITFFDFDFAGKGFLANDLLSFSLHFFFHMSAHKITREEADRQFAVFLDAYKTIRFISDEEVAAIPYLGFGFWTFYLSFQYENFEDWSNSFFSPRYLKDFVDTRIKRYVDLFCHF